ncbi:L-rhamnose mutarotase [Microbacterium sp. A204]|uniref:L-rhamnose mutarotase n=1 Tax=Microbacterium sp. A204 TaxID=3457321 RepID=UPI003FD3DDEC
MTRIAFQITVHPEMIDEYIARHSPVWPEMLAEIAASGRRNYSIFLGAGGNLFGYYETDDEEASRAHLAASEVAAKWEASMAPFFVGVEGRVDQVATLIPEVFNLGDQLAAVDA